MDARKDDIMMELNVASLSTILVMPKFVVEIEDALTDEGRNIFTVPVDKITPIVIVDSVSVDAVNELVLRVDNVKSFTPRVLPMILDVVNDMIVKLPVMAAEIVTDDIGATFGITVDAVKEETITSFKVVLPATEKIVDTIELVVIDDAFKEDKRILLVINELVDNVLAFNEDTIPLILVRVEPTNDETRTGLTNNVEVRPEFAPVVVTMDDIVVIEEA